MKNIAILILALLFAGFIGLYSFDAEAAQSEIPYSLSWEMTESQINKNLSKAGFKVKNKITQDLSDEMAEVKRQFEDYGFKKLYFIVKELKKKLLVIA